MISPVRPLLCVIGGKWKAVIPFFLTHDAAHRFAELRPNIPGASERVPVRRFRDLTKDGIAHGEIYCEVPPGVG